MQIRMDSAPREAITTKKRIESAPQEAEALEIRTQGEKHIQKYLFIRAYIKQMTKQHMEYVAHTGRSDGPFSWAAARIP